MARKFVAGLEAGDGGSVARLEAVVLKHASDVIQRVKRKLFLVAPEFAPVVYVAPQQLLDVADDGSQFSGFELGDRSFRLLCSGIAVSLVNCLKACRSRLGLAESARRAIVKERDERVGFVGPRETATHRTVDFFRVLACAEVSYAEQ